MGCPVKKIWTYLIYVVATGLIVVAALSNTLTPIDSDNCVAEVQFNQDWFNGSVNGIPVQNLMTLRLGNWAACLYDNQTSDRCFEVDVAYKVTITTGNSTHTIVQSYVTWALTISVGAAATTCLTLFHPLFSECYWVELVAFTTTTLLLIADAVFLLLVRNGMQSIGEAITTNPGHGLYYALATDIFIIVGSILRRSTIQDAKAEEKRNQRRQAQQAEEDAKKEASRITKENNTYHINVKETKKGEKGKKGKKGKKSSDPENPTTENPTTDNPTTEEPATSFGLFGSLARHAHGLFGKRS